MGKASVHAAAWGTRAAELARWALERFFVRTDRCGKFYFCSTTGEVKGAAHPKGGPQEGCVSLPLLERHFRARGHGDVLGAFTLAPGTSAGKWCAIDCDNHEDNAELPELHRMYAEGRHEFLTHLGFRPLVLDYGNGSFHIVVLLDRTRPGEELKRFAEWFRGDKSHHEVFPKQTIVPADGCGNWLRLVGRHKSRDVWARVYDGANWLEGPAAVAHVLSLTGESPDLIPEHVRFPKPNSTEKPPGQKRTAPDRGERESVFERYNREATLDQLIEHCIAAGHQLLKRSPDRATFTRAGKTGGESFNLKAKDGTVLCYNFSSNAGLPAGEALNPSHLRCWLRFGGVTDHGLRELAVLLEGELGIPPRQRAAPGQQGKHQTNGRGASAEQGAGVRTQTGEAGDTSGELEGEDFEHIEPNLDVRDFVEGLLTEGGMSVVYGDSNTGKTFLVLDLSFHVAEGESWLGREVERGAVMYLAIESPESVRQRVGAYKKAKCRNGAALPWRLFPESIDLRSASVDALRVVSAAKRASEDFGVPVKLVIVDTLARAMAGGNENSPDDMGALVQNIDMIQKNTKAHVLVIHHCGKDAAKGMRGHSSLRAATDTELELTHDDAARVSTVRAAKQRDMTKGEQFSFRLEVVELGTNRRGSTVTSCVVREAVAPAKGGAGLKGDAGALLSVLEEAIQKSGKPGYEGVPEGLASVPLKWLRDRFYARKAGGTQDAKQKAFKRALHTLVTAGRAAESADRVWLTTTGQTGQEPDMSGSSDPAIGPDRPDSSL